jgi:hypothetical protein
MALCLKSLNGPFLPSVDPADRWHLCNLRVGRSIATALVNPLSGGTIYSELTRLVCRERRDYRT